MNSPKDIAASITYWTDIARQQAITTAAGVATAAANLLAQQTAQQTHDNYLAGAAAAVIAYKLLK